MFGNEFLDSLPNWKILQNIVDKVDNENAIDNLFFNVRTFVKFKRLMQQNRMMSLEALNELGFSFDKIWLCVFFIAYHQGFQSISLTIDAVTYS